MAATLIRAQIAALACSALLAGCATPQTDALKQAEAEFQQAQSDPKVRENAAVPLREARQALDQAQTAGGRDEVNHLAFLAERKAELAQAVAARRTAEENVETLSGVREKILLQARAEEAEQAEKEAATAEARAEQLESELAALQAEAEETERGTVLTLSDVLFEFDSSSLKAGVQRNLEPLALFLRQNPKRDVIIEGHTDSVGSTAYNEQLSFARADAVRSYLIQQGIDPNRITARGLGEAFPVATNETVAGRQQNRRVDVVIQRES